MQTILRAMAFASSIVLAGCGPGGLLGTKPLACNAPQSDSVISAPDSFEVYVGGPPDHQEVSSSAGDRIYEKDTCQGIARVNFDPHSGYYEATVTPLTVGACAITFTDPETDCVTDQVIVDPAVGYSAIRRES
jgi:hypothetical protein